jgi:hypothetical protein
MNASSASERSKSGLKWDESAAGGWSRSLWVVLVVLVAALVILKWHENLPLFSMADQPHQRLPLMAAIDSESYFLMAKDGPGEVSAPFTKRVLYPWLVRMLSQATGSPIPDMFLALNFAALLGTAFCLAEILRITVGRPFMALLFLLTPFPLESFELAYIPDLFHIALISLFFLLLLREREKGAVLILFLAFLTRESTLLLCVFAIGLALYRGKGRFALAVSGVLCVGLAVSSWLARFGKPNMHHLPDFLWQIGKVPYYFLLNLFGFRIWSNVRPEQGHPWVTWPLPSWAKFGTDSVIGIAYPDWRYPISTLIVWLTCFGLGPLIIYGLVRKSKGPVLLPFPIALAFLYGLASYLMGPLLGDWVDRLVGCGWPAFWLAMPYLLYSPSLRCKPSWIRLLALGYFITCWWPRFFGYGSNRSVNPWPCLAVLLFYFIGACMMRNISPVLVPADTRSKGH